MTKLLALILISAGAISAHADPRPEIIRACGKVSKQPRVVSACLEDARSTAHIRACKNAGSLHYGTFLRYCFKSRLDFASIAACAKVSSDLRVQTKCLASAPVSAPKPAAAAPKKVEAPVTFCLVSARCEKVTHEHGGIGSDSEFEILNSNPDGVRFTLIYKRNGRREVIRSEERSYYNCYDCSAKSFVRAWNKEMPEMLARCEQKAQPYRDGLDACGGALGANDHGNPVDVSNEGLARLEPVLRRSGPDSRDLSIVPGRNADHGI